MKYNSYIFKAFMLLAGVGAFTSSCEDMLETDSKFVIYDDHLSTPADTANSLVGIIYQLQAIAERTQLLGDVRSDLVSVTSGAAEALQQMADFTMTDENEYNNPRDYYAVINNCNYYLANVDLNIVDSKSDRVFWHEYVQVKAIRAWTYLQLALNYGSVPFYTEPILTEVDAAKDYPRKSLTEICDYFIAELTEDPSYSTAEFPALGLVGSINLQYCMFPVDVVLGDLYLWRASVNHSQADYRDAASRYCSWIFRTGNVGGYNKTRYNIPANSYQASWVSLSLKDNPQMVDNVLYGVGEYGRLFSSPRDGGSEAVTVIPMDSLAYQGYYNNIRYYYTNVETSSGGMMSLRSDDYCIYPSAHLQELSQAQDFAYYYLNEGESEPQRYDFALSTERPVNNGDLRLASIWYTYTRDGGVMEATRSIQQLNKPVTGRDIWVYRKTDLFLRLAEALNNGGFPRFAHAILKNGIGLYTVRDSVMPYCDAADLAYISNVLNANNDFNYYESRDGFKDPSTNASNFTMGIHSRGCGYAELNENYVYPAVSPEGNADYAEKEAMMQDALRAYIQTWWETFEGNKDDFLATMYGVDGGFSAVYPNMTEDEVFEMFWNNGDSRVVDGVTYSLTCPAQSLSQWWTSYGDNKEQEMRAVDQLILDEMALETCLEGKRFYDLMRHALRYNDNSIVADPVSRRNGEQNGALHDKLMIRNNWYLSWQGKIGLQ